MSKGHGRSKDPIYTAWKQMVARCHRPKNDRYRYYGGRGIAVCDRWRRFEHFLADMGERPTPKHSVERIDNDGNYEPGNCKWATVKGTTQQHEQKHRSYLQGRDDDGYSMGRWP